MIPTPVIRTPISMKDFARAAILAIRVTSDTPSKEACGVLWAQYAIETGAGGFCWNHNLFNHKCTQAQAAAGVPYMMLAGTTEFDAHGVEHSYQPPDPVTWFRAYTSFESAMSDHVSAIKMGRYASSWPSVLAGDPLTYAAEIRAHGYYTAPLKDYQKGMLARMGPWTMSPAYEDALAAIEESALAVTQEIPPATVTRLPFSDDDPDEPPAAA